MAEAEVGDDWYGDDPTVNRLQDRAAELTGREAAAYLPTGTMCTQVALHAMTRSGRLVACEATAHVFLPPVAPVRMHRELGLTDGQVSIPIPNSDSAAVSGRFFLLTAGTGRCDPPGLTNWAPFAGEGRPNLATGG